MKELRTLIFYFGIGALFHVAFQGPHLDWSSAWTFAWLLAWPLALFVTVVLLLAQVALWLFVALIAIVVVVGVAFIFVDAIDGYLRRNRGRGASWKRKSPPRSTFTR